MATLGTAGKMRRVLEFLLGLRDERILGALAAHGFGAAERKLGWELLGALGMTQSVPVVTTPGNATLTALDAWRREWLRLVRASLSQSHPEICSQLFYDLDNARGGSFSVVPQFLVRLAKLERARDPASRSALAKLRERGFLPAHVKEAQRLVTELTHAAPPPTRDLDGYRAAIRQAEDALWAYYLEWSQLARAVIRDVRWLERLGYRGSQTIEDEESESASVREAAPTPELVKPKPAVGTKPKARRTPKARKTAR